ncbi:TIGR02611 family protein [Streptomyces sp. NBC_01724]|uniref:TIGR02611 family protein n=1 Tax=Streptomyces TaxID=1883 RepID=UPI002E2F1516|nr:TIGR02611 family protein [Streptomyces sp. NBC_01724]WTE50675.1 TIGR02611 family protein [Streptomyces sp. NBC_01620]WTE58745.1 TIGR02611 family protein [Streptomyces sp. NBC_01617]
MNAESDARDEAAAPAAPAPATGDVTGDVAPDVTEGVTKGERELGSRAPGFIKASRALHVSWQVGVFVVGLAVVVAGIIMLPLPGPGWLVIFGGMAIWATEFVWAQLVLRWTRRKVTEAAQKALDPKVRRRNIILTVVGLVIIAVLVGIYVWKFGITMPWKIHE